jgi:sugar lactone lactonase YvrE
MKKFSVMNKPASGAVVQGRTSGTGWMKWLMLGILAGGFLFSACAPRQSLILGQPDRTIVWPGPPLEPRIQWVREIRTPQDAGAARGFWQRLGRFIGGEAETGIVRPYGVFLDDRDRLFIVDTGAALVHLMDTETGRYTMIAGENDNAFRTPIAITEDDDENVYITDADAGTIFRYNLKEGVLRRFTTFKLERPTGLAFSRAKRLLYVTDTGAHQIVALDLAGKERFRFGARGAAPGQFNYPTDLCVDKIGRVIVTDALNFRIQIFSPEGSLLDAFGEAGDTSGSFAKPKGVALDSEGHIYVCDALFDSVQIFDDRGRLLLGFGDSGSKQGQLWMPSGIYIDRNDYIYVADSYNQRVQVFRYLKDDAQLNGHGENTEKLPVK